MGTRSKLEDLPHRPWTQALLPWGASGGVSHFPLAAGGEGRETRSRGSGSPVSNPLYVLIYFLLTFCFMATYEHKEFAIGQASHVHPGHSQAALHHLSSLFVNSVNVFFKVSIILALTCWLLFLQYFLYLYFTFYWLVYLKSVCFAIYFSTFLPTHTRTHTSLPTFLRAYLPVYLPTHLPS